MLRDLLVHVDGSDGGRRRVKLAVGLAQRLDARLTGLHVTPAPDIEPLYRPSLVDAAVARAAEKLMQDARNAATIFHEETARVSPDTKWVEAAGDVVHGVCARARYADMVILGQYEQQDSPQRHPLPIAHSAVLKCGRPVLVVPETVETSVFSKVAIAWDSSREAVRAIHDALPLLRVAGSVDIVSMIVPTVEHDETDGASLSAHMAHHGINVAKDIVQVRTLDEHHALRQQIEHGHYDLLVMGAYSHPVWMEFIFGGPTESTLFSSKTPVLVSH